jgi:phosphoenolpyruvate---glycerone phosphotransferase subunit DhaM
VAAFVGVVLVSHSFWLASGLRTLVTQIGTESVPVAAAGGTADGGIGTSYELVRDAIERVDHGVGVIVLPDLGSAVLTARAVLADHPRPGVLLVDAPFVEGAVAAVVAASIGADVATVAAEAAMAREIRKF